MKRDSSKYQFANYWMPTSFDSFKISLLSEWPRMTQGIPRFTSISALYIEEKYIISIMNVPK